MSKHPIVKSEALPWMEDLHRGTAALPPSIGDKFGSRRKRLGDAAGGRQLGCGLFEVAPGKRAFPYHYHCANEEALYILDGRGTLRLGAREEVVEAGDYVALPAGPDHAHQLINTGTEPLRYLCISTMIPTEIAVYPDSDKIGALAAAPGDPSTRYVMKVFRGDTHVGYYDGEE